MNRVVVTGGAGFIGSHVVDALLAKGAEVLVIDNFSTGRESNLAQAQSGAGKLSVVRESICSEAAREALVAFKPDAVFHLAAQINVRKSVDSPPFDAHENVVGTVSMLEAARLAGTKKFVFSSTGGAIYGEQDYFPADEKHPVRPKCPYGVSKRASELYLAYYAQECGMGTVSVRFSNVYGPRQNPHGEAGVVAIFTDRLFAGEMLRVNGDGGQTRDFVFVGDVVNACLLACGAATESSFEVFNVGRGVESSVNEIVDVLREIWTALFPETSDSSFRVENGPDLRGEQRRSVIDAGKLTSRLGWQPEVDLSEGLDRTIRSFHEKT